MKTKTVHKLSIKLIIAISAVLIFILAVHTYITITNLAKYLTQNRLNSAYNISDLIKKSTRYSMLLDRREDVHQIIKTIGTETGVKRIRIYNKQGVIIFSTDSTEILKKVDMSEDACIVCHKQSAPLRSLSQRSTTRYYTTRDERVLGLINPIQNEKDCYTGSCHAHESGVEVLGVLDVMMSLKELDFIIAANTKTTITNAVIITLVISGICGLFIIILVNKPLRKLNVGFEELGKGNLEYKIEINSEDELGNAGRKFNDMSAKLNAAYKEIKEWSETLNKKVQEKTEELKNIYAQIIQVEKLASLGKLSATVAHELNNPLEGILTYSKLITKKMKAGGNTDSAKLIDYLELISGETARCGRIVKDLLLFSHRGDDKFTEETLSPIIDKSVTLINHHLEIHSIVLNKEYPDEEIIVCCNPQKIQQALMSMLINAIEAMPGGGKITIRLTRENNGAAIRIIDEGTGIPEKDLPHIFEPFYSTKEASKGTGLGLAVVYGIINNHNGNVEVEQTSPHGTTFKINLPIKT